MKLKDIHIGTLIEEKFEKKCRRDKTFNKAEFARRLGVDRSTVYKLFEKKSCDIDQLLEASEILDFDFLGEVYLKHFSSASPPIIVGIAISPEQLKRLELPEGFISLAGQLSEL